MRIPYIIMGAAALTYTCLATPPVSASDHQNVYPMMVEHNIDVSRMMPVRAAGSHMQGAQKLSTFKVPTSPSIRPDIELRGSVIASSEWGASASSRKYGIYSAKADNQGSFSITPIALDSKLNATTGAVMTPKGYFVISTTSYMGYYLVDHYLFDPKDWSVISRTASDMESMARSLTYNPADAKIYGCFANLDGSFSFSSLDMKSGDRKRITPRMENPYSAMAADNSGTIYAIDYAGDLITIDAKTGENTLVAQLSLPSVYTTSACFDPVSGSIMYVQAREDASELFSIDPVEGTAEAIGIYPDGLQWGGLYVPDPVAESEAPAEPSSLSASFEGGSLEGEISFTAPQTLYNGAPAEGEMNWELTLDDNIIANGLCQPGETVTVPVKVDAAGLYSFGLRLSNRIGISPLKVINSAVGPDIPVAVSEVILNYDSESETAELSWVAPDRGVNDGWLDPAALTYNIVRYPDGVNVAEGISSTSWSEHFPKPEGLHTLRYTVTPAQEGRKGEPTFSNAVALGNISLPYEADFHSPGILDSFFVADANGDGVTWTPDEKDGAFINYSSVQMNDWLITAPLEMKKGMVYAVTVDAWSQSVRHDERLALWIGTGMEPAKMDRRIISRSLDGNPGPNTSLVTVEEDGIYHFGLQGCSPAGQYILRLGSLSIAAPVPQEAPEAPRFLTMEPNAQGELSLTGRLLVPMNASDGSKLLSLKSFVVKRGEVEVFHSEEVAPGQIVTFYDNPEKAGAYSYTAVAESEIGLGVVSEVKAFVGVNVPAAPSNVKYVDGIPGGELTWSATRDGADGLQLNTADITYHVYNKNFEEIGSTKTTTYPLILSSDKALSSIYYVKAETSAGFTPDWNGVSQLINLNPGQGELNMSVTELEKNSVTLSHADGRVSGPADWYVEGVGMNGRQRLCADLDKSEGSALVVLPPVTLKNPDEESFFRFYYTPEADDTELSVYVIDGSLLFQLHMAEADYAAGETHEILLPIEDFYERTVNLAVSVSGKGKVSLSNPLVTWRRPVDIRVEELWAPETHTRGIVPMRAYVVNLGKEASEYLHFALIGKYTDNGTMGIEDDMDDFFNEDSGIFDGSGCLLQPGEGAWLDLDAFFAQYREDYLYFRLETYDMEETHMPISSPVARVMFEDSGLPAPYGLNASMGLDQKTVRLKWETPEGLDENLCTEDGKVLRSYNIYCNKILRFIRSASYNDAIIDMVPAANGVDRIDSYTIVANYYKEESIPSEPCDLMVSEVLEIASSDAPTLRVESSGDEILLYGAQGPVDVYSVNGMKIMRLEASKESSEAPLRLRLQPGVYILTDGNTVLRLRL